MYNLIKALLCIQLFKNKHSCLFLHKTEEERRSRLLTPFKMSAVWRIPSFPLDQFSSRVWISIFPVLYKTY